MCILVCFHGAGGWGEGRGWIVQNSPVLSQRMHLMHADQPAYASVGKRLGTGVSAPVSF